MATSEPKTQIKIGPARGSYANLFKPRAVNDGDEPKYSISLLFPKKDEKKLAELKKVIAFVAEKKFGPKWKTLCKRLPIRDGDVDKPEHPEYAGMYFINCSSSRAPGVVNRQLVPVMNEDEAYSGCYFIASVNVFPYDHKIGGKGISLGLTNIMGWEKGDRLDSRKEAAADFAEYGSEGESESSEEEDPLD
jgi:hypothetical protein